MAHLALVLLGAGGGGTGPASGCYAPGTSGTVTAPTGATGCTVEMWGGGGGGGAATGTPGYGGGGAAYIKRSFSVTGGTTQIAYSVGAKGTGATGFGMGVSGGDSTVDVPAGGPFVISLSAGGGIAGDDTLPGNPGIATTDGGIPFPAGTAPTMGSLGAGGNAGNQPTGGAGGKPGVTPGGGGDGDDSFGWDGGDGSLCFYWTYPTNVVLSDQTALNLSLAGVGGSATATYRLDNAGQASRTNVSGTLVNITGQWLTSGTASNYEVYAQWSPSSGGPGSVLGGGTTGGATPDTWLSLGTTRSFTLTGVSAHVERELYIQIRNAATQEIVNFCTITVEVDSAP